MQARKLLNFQKFASQNIQRIFHGDFIPKCRNGELHRYDIVEGPMADDTVWNYVNDFLAGDMTREQFWSFAKFKYPTHQISFHTLAALNCLTFDQVADEIIEHYQIGEGNFDTISNCKYTVPNVTSIGKLYCRLICQCAEPNKEIIELMKVFQSFISDEISDYKTGVYYQNPSYLKCSYEEGYLLD